VSRRGISVHIDPADSNTQPDFRSRHADSAVRFDDGDEGVQALGFVGDFLDYPQGGLATTDKKIQEKPNPSAAGGAHYGEIDDPYPAEPGRTPLLHRWKMEKERGIELRHHAEGFHRSGNFVRFCAPEI